MITEDEADFNKNIHNESGGVMNRRWKLQKATTHINNNSELP